MSCKHILCDFIVLTTFFCVVMLIHHMKSQNKKRWDETLHNRIKAIRKYFGLSQSTFGEKLGVSRDVISNLEYNRVQPKEPLIKHICERYSVDEKWLLSGEGEMISKGKSSNKLIEEVITLFNQLEPDFQEYFLEYMKGLSELQSKVRN
ncbi:helix-turn-helix domain-containing protein [Paenibacillus amylolyticus]|uniref:helix-turn-helix domain-containing protein n=1 Tax=Paenibacillus amylolyticus TaxID=1451 RepID=UPI003EBFCF00